ncbi:MAG: DUF2849 domain-containing protein [Rhodospirillaceae bacterium]|nr:MAG: DUF2849 domain-containing protein [Rhodospirillaceae bacterium]
MPRDEIEPSAVSAGRRAGRAAVGGKIATANRLRDGVVVYLDAAGGWTTEVAQARIAHSSEDEQALKAALDSAVRANLIVDAAVIDTRAAESTPARLREQIRAVGPTVRPDLARRKPL